MRIEKAPLSVRAVNALRNTGYATVEQCYKLNEKSLLKIKNLGIKTAREILNYIETVRPFQRDLFSENPHQPQPLSEEALEYSASALSIPIADIVLSVRTRNVVKKLGLVYLRDLVKCAPDRLKKAQNSGKKTIAEIESILNQLNLKHEVLLPANLELEIHNRISISSNKEVSAIVEFRKKYPNKGKMLDELKRKIISEDKISHYEKAFRLYKSLGTLDLVGHQMGITRERVRQILVKGTACGLFDYKGIEYPYISYEALTECIIKHLSLNKVSKETNIACGHLRRLLAAYEITPEKLADLVQRGRKNREIDEYLSVKEKLGHDPTTTELQANAKWRAMEARIRRYWGSFDSFRQELSIPKPPQGNPKLKEHVRSWVEQKQRLGLIRRLQRLDDIRQFVGQNNCVSSAEISMNCNIKPQTLWPLLKILQSTGEIEKVGEGFQTKYKKRCK